jgi:bleomycin hydrolase
MKLLSRTLLLTLVTLLIWNPCCYALLQDDLRQASEVPQDSQAKPGTGETSGQTPYSFTLLHGSDCTEVKSQDSTGTCWSFATASFIESELLRRGKGEHNLSEMFIVYNIYRDKARNFILRQGKANFSEGALAHDFINSAGRYGLVPEEVFAGREEGTRHNHGEMVAILEGMLNGIVQRNRLSPRWERAFEAVLGTYLGTVPERFSYQGRSYSPREFAESLDFRIADYANLTSFNHHPFYEHFVLEIPDNFSNGRFYNLPLDEMMTALNYALENGFTVAWDGDVSEPGFSQGYGLAILPTDPNRADRFANVGEEQTVTQENRQAAFFSKETTDDHLMHITGVATDSLGNRYYLIKNSWGKMGPFEGNLYASEAYIRMKTVSLLIHRDGLPPSLRGVQ